MNDKKMKALTKEFYSAAKGIADHERLIQKGKEAILESVKEYNKILERNGIHGYQRNLAHAALSFVKKQVKPQDYKRLEEIRSVSTKLRRAGEEFYRQHHDEITTIMSGLTSKDLKYLYVRHSIRAEKDNQPFWITRGYKIKRKDWGKLSKSRHR